MNKRLAATVLETFRTDRRPETRLHLEQFPPREWQHTMHWLDASGLALYFLRELQSQNIEHAVPPPVLSQLEQRLQDNTERTNFLFAEFARINAVFRAAGLRYVNLKGFTLRPDYCPDLSLRYQTDCDFLMARSDAERSCDLLARFGYRVVAGNDHVLEFKTDVGATPSVDDLYKIRPERSVEIHLCDSERCDRHPALLERSRELRLEKERYPALSLEDMFLSQAYHLFRHLRSEWTRLSWFLELRHFVVAHRENMALWAAVGIRAAQHHDSATAVGLVIRFAEATLGYFAPLELANWSVRQIPAQAVLWIDRYARNVALTDFPGSKLYLILEQALATSASPANLRRRLFPTRVPAPIVVAPSTGIMRRVQAFAARTAYACFRLRFHLGANAQYLLESWRWSRQRRDISGPNLTQAPTQCAPDAVTDLHV